MTITWHTPAISLAAFDVLWQSWCLDTAPPDARKPILLDCPSPGATASERRRVEQDAYQELAAATTHLNAGGMRALYPLLAALAWPNCEMDLRWHAPTPLRAMAVRHNDLGVLACKTDSHIWFALRDPWTQPSDLVELLPARPAAQVYRGQQSVDATLLRKARARINNDAASTSRQQPWTTMRQALQDVGVREDAGRAFANLVDQRCVGRGEFRVILPGGPGRRRRASTWIRVNDTEKGRYLLTIDDRHWITVRGADDTTLVDQLRAVLHQLANDN